MTSWKRRASVLVVAVALVLVGGLYVAIFSERTPAPVVVARPLPPTPPAAPPPAAPQPADPPSEHPAEPEVEFRVRVEGPGEGLQGMLRFPQAHARHSTDLHGDGWLLHPLDGPFADGVLRADALPWSPYYQLFLWDDDGRWAAARYEAPGHGAEGRMLDAGVVRLREPAGINLTITDAPAPDDRFFQLRLQQLRPPQSQEDELFALLLQAARPELAAALMPVALEDAEPPSDDEFTAWEITHGETALLAPLPPSSALQIRIASADKSREGRAEVVLQEEGITSVTLSLARVFVGEVQGCLSLRVKLEDSTSGAPLGGLRVEQRGSGESSFFTTTADGTLTIPCVSRSEPTSLRIVQEPPRPERHDFVFRPGRVREHLNVAEVRWPVPVWCQVIAALTPEEDARLRKQSVAGYPLFSLQRLEPGDLWVDLEQPEVSQQEEAVLSANVEASGTYRMAIATAPFSIRVSEAVEVSLDSGDSVSVQEWTTPASQDLIVRVVFRDGGEPVSGVFAEVRGTTAAGTPAAGTTDADGLLSLGPVNTPQIFLTLLHNGRRSEHRIPLNPPPKDGLVEVMLER